MIGKLFFTLTYWFGVPPWDTGVTPPEVHKFLEENPPGKALDLGCGTGTNVITLAEHGWLAEGVDYVPRAVKTAKRKARKNSLGDSVKFRVGDVLSQSAFQGDYDLILDIGCFHSFSGENINRYIENISSHLSSAGSFLLYVHLDESSGTGHGATEESLKKLGEKLKLVQRIDGEESSRPSAWLEFRKV